MDGMTAPVEGDGSTSREAVDALYRLAYDELRRLAAAIRRTDPNAVLSTRTLVHETWLRLADSPEFRYLDQKHLRNIVARTMRQVLVDSARYRKAAKRSGTHVDADDTIPTSDQSADELLAIHDALTRLESLDAEQAGIVEEHFFGDRSFAEIAERRGISEATVRRRWKAASALLQVWLDGAS
jgi:RNA polymerase sigma factor (TIGR02999 family)